MVGEARKKASGTLDCAYEVSCRVRFKIDLRKNLRFTPTVGSPVPADRPDSTCIHYTGLPKFSLGTSLDPVSCPHSCNLPITPNVTIFRQ